MKMGRIKIGGKKLKSNVNEKADNETKNDDLDLNETQFEDKKNIKNNKIGKIQFKAIKKLNKQETKSTFTKVFF
jgi:hypothetical protein